MAKSTPTTPHNSNASNNLSESVSSSDEKPALRKGLQVRHLTMMGWDPLLVQVFS